MVPPQTYQLLMRGHELSDGRMGILCEAQSKHKIEPEHNAQCRSG